MACCNLLQLVHVEAKSIIAYVPFDSSYSTCSGREYLLDGRLPLFAVFVKEPGWNMISRFTVRK